MSPTSIQSRILIVDDEPANVLLMRRVLESAGYQYIKGITDPRTTLEVRDAWKPDLIILDLQMPHIDGIAQLRIFQAQNSTPDFVPVLVLTADSTREALKRALTAGANDFLTKPVDVDEVQLRVRNLLAIRMSYTALRNSNVALAEELRRRVQCEARQAADRASRVKAIRSVIDRRPTMLFQPIVELATRKRIGYEALARFETGTSPAAWFAEATRLGLGPDLELAAVKAAISTLDHLPKDMFLAVNVSPSVVLDRRLHEMVRSSVPERIVIEITEHQPVESYSDLGMACRKLRHDGVRIAIDDAGAGYASLHHILKLAPDVIKLDMDLTRDVDRDPVKRALATSLVRFATETNAIVTAEGIETSSELDTLRELGAPWGQGFFIGHPAPLEPRASRVSGARVAR